MASSYPYYSRYSPRPRPPIWPLILLVVLAGVLVWRFWPKSHPNLTADLTPRAVDARGPLAADELANIKVYHDVSPSVVHITNLIDHSAFSLNPVQIPRGTGTGFIWDDNGIVVTNAHVVEGADTMQVVLADKDRTSFKTKAWVSYPDKDLAVLHVDAPKKKLPRIPLIGESKDLKVGQRTYAIGNPFGLDQTLTMGIVSALNREIKTESGRPIQGAIQTSAAINPGNSGGPLLDSEGRLIGVNTAILSPSGTFAGIGFAIPIDEVNRVVPLLVAKLDESIKKDQGPAEVSPPKMGVKLAPDEVAQQLGVTEGVLVLEVVPGSPAARAGLRATVLSANVGRRRLGDVIVAIDGQPVNSTQDVYTVLEGHKAGDTVKVTIVRNDQRQDVNITLAALR